MGLSSRRHSRLQKRYLELNQPSNTALELFGMAVNPDDSASSKRAIYLVRNVRVVSQYGN